MEPLLLLKIVIIIYWNQGWLQGVFYKTNSLVNSCYEGGNILAFQSFENVTEYGAKFSTESGAEM